MRYLVENSPTLEMVVNAVISRLDNSVKIQPRRSAKNYLDEEGGSAYNGPFKMSFDADGKLFITGGVFEANGIFMIAPAGNIMPTLGYVCLCYNISDAEIYYSIIESLPENNDKNILITPLGHITKNEDGGALQIAQWFWDIPSMSNPVQLPAFTSNDGTVSITHDVENNTVDFSVPSSYSPVMQGSMNNVFEIVKDDESQQYQFRYKDEYETVRIAGDHLLYGDSNGHLQTMAWSNVTAKNYLMVYSNDLHYGLAAPGDAGDFVMVNNRNEGIKWLAVDSFSTGVNLTSPEQTINITPKVSEDGTVSTELDLAPFYLQEYIESTDDSIKITKLSDRGINLSVTKGLLQDVSSPDDTIFFNYSDNKLALDVAAYFLYNNVKSKNGSVTIKSTGDNTIDLSVDGLIEDTESPRDTVDIIFTDNILKLDVTSDFLSKHITSSDKSISVKQKENGVVDLSVDVIGVPTFESPDASIFVNYVYNGEIISKINLEFSPTCLREYIKSTDGSIKIINADNGGVNLSVAGGGSLAPTLKSSNGTISFQYNYDAEGVLKDIDATVNEFSIVSSDETVSIQATLDANMRITQYDLSVPFYATEITSKDESVVITTLKNAEGEVYGYDLSAAGISGIPESGDGVLARINGVWQFIEMTDECE